MSFLKLVSANLISRVVMRLPLVGHPALRLSEIAHLAMLDEPASHLAGAGCFFGFFASLFLRCCPLAMIVLLVWIHHCVTVLIQKTSLQSPLF